MKPLSFSRWIGLSFSLVFIANVARAQYQYSWLNYWGWPTAKPANVDVYGNATVHGGDWAIRLVDAGNGQLGTMIVNRPAGVPAEKFTYFDAYFDFVLVGGDGADGMSFSYGPVANGNNGGGEDGLTSGLAVSFDVYRAGGDTGHVKVRYNNSLIANVAFDLWDSRWENQYLRAFITYSSSGLTVRIESVNHTPFFIKDAIEPLRNVHVSGWAPQADWRFVMGGRTGADNLAARANFINITTSSSPPYFVTVPTTAVLNEDITSDVSVVVGDFEDTPGTVLTATSGNQNLIPNANISVLHDGGGSRRIRLVPAANTSGSGTIFLTVSQGGQSEGSSFSFQINAVNDPPAITVSSPQTTPEDTPLDVAVTLSDLDNAVSALSLTATSDNQALLPNGNIIVTGSGGTRTVRLSSSPDASGTAVITLSSSDGAATTTRLFTVNVTAVNDPPVAGSFNAIRGGPSPDGAVRTPSMGLVSGNSPHTVETWIRLDGPPVNSFGMLLGPAAFLGLGSHYWHFNASSATAATVRFGSGLRWESPTAVTIPIGIWTHLAVSWDGTNHAVYLNGILQGVTPYTAGDLFAIQNGALTLGGRVNFIFVSFAEMPASFDEARVWQRALTEAEIQQRLSIPLRGNESDLLVYWRFDEGTGRLAYDSATLGGRANGILGAGAVYTQRALTGQNGLLGEYYNSTDLTSLRATRIDSTVNFNDSTGPFHPAVGSEFFSVRWSGSVLASTSGTYTFGTWSDDGVRLWVNGEQIVDNWTLHGSTLNTGSISLTGGQRYDIRMEFFENSGFADARLVWQPPSTGALTVIPAANLFPVPAFERLDFGTLVVNEETATSIFLPGFDVELFRSEPGASLSYTIDTPPAHGSLNFTSGDWSSAARNPVTYTPNTAYNGPDSFTYHVTDNFGIASPSVTVNLNVTELNDPPVISTIADLAILEDTSTGPIPFTVTDQDHPATTITVRTRSSDTRLTGTNITISGTGSDRTITITPVQGEIGTVTIELTATDPLFGQSVRSFKLRVDPKPAYALVDLGDLGLRNLSFGSAINDAGWAVGHAQSQPGDRHATLFRGLAGSAGLEDLGTLGGGGTISFANAINRLNRITGGSTATAGGVQNAFLWQDGVLSSLASSLTALGSDSVGLAINDSGDIGGSLQNFGNGRRGFRILSGAAAQLLNPLAGHSASEAFSLNAAAEAAGYSAPASGAERAVIWSNGTATAISLGTLPGHFSSRALGINDSGLMVGYSTTNNANGLRRAFLYQNGTMMDLGTLADGNTSEAYGINSFGQVVGTATRSGSPVAWVRIAGVNYDLNNLIYDSRTFIFADSNWNLQQARSISRNGTLVGTGKRSGSDRAFMAVPAWVIGKQIGRPEGAVERLPEIEIISGNPQDAPQNAFFWSTFERRLYAIRPVTARLKWFTSFNDTVGTGTNIQSNTERIETIGISVWPKEPTIHVATAPVNVEPADVPFDYGYQSIIHETTGGAARVDPTAKVFTCDRTGYSVLFYLHTRGAQPAPDAQPPYFEVVRTVTWDDPMYKKERNGLVGQKLEDPPVAAMRDPGHQEYQGRNGFVLFEKAFYDGTGADRAYDRPTRLGPIIPVNLDTPAANDDLVVVWYRFSRIGVAWASRPVRYSIAWPTDNVVDHIVIASTQGSGPLPATAYANPRVYDQPDKLLPGYNPNEEHALIAPSNGGTGEALFALRNDLNARINPRPSEPYALLKYQDPATTQWCIKVFKVVAEDAAHRFRYSGVAGNEIQPPYPLSILPLAGASHGTLGQYWEDYLGRLYARAAGVEGSDTTIRIQWFYPLQPGFFYDFNGDGQSDAAVGTELPWLDRRAANDISAPNAGAGAAGTPIDVVYDIRWPNVPTLQIGETLLDPKNGLPGVKDMARVETIYDDLNPTWDPAIGNAPVTNLARLYDPLSTRVLKLATGDEIPVAVKRQNVAGKEIFVDLPFVIRSRLKYDPINRWLLFSGILDDSYAGEPLLLPNVLSSRERDRIKALAVGNTSWAGIVDRLYDLTRNPNSVDLDKNGVVDQALRIGLTSQYSYSYRDTNEPPGTLTGQTLALLTQTEIASLPAFESDFTYTDTNVVVEPLGDLPKALTAGLGGIPAAATQPGRSLSFDGAQSPVDAGNLIDLAARPFTIEFWAKRGASSAVRQVVIGQGTASPNGRLGIGFNASHQLFFEYDTGGAALVSPAFAADVNQWVHWACSFDPNTGARAIFRNGQLVATDTPAAPYSGSGKLWIGQDGAATAANRYVGELDEVRIWTVTKSASALARDRGKRLLGDEDGLLRYFRFDEASGSAVIDSSSTEQNATLVGAVTRADSTAPTGMPPRYMTLVENNDGSLGALPVTLHIIRIDDGPFRGDLKRLLPDNVFDERLTMRHSSDFGGDPDQVVLEWYYKPDGENFDPEDLPTVNPDGTIANTKGWIRYSNVTPPSGQGVNDVTLGEGGESGLFAVTDNWWICRYRGYNVGLNGADTWSDWIGDPSGVSRPRAALAEGWVKRVIIGLNPFDARVKDFHVAPVNTYSSMLVQAGPRYEGPIAFNPSADNLNSIGLIEAYTTVLDRARSKSIDGTPQVNYNPANNALLLAASRISDLYMLIGNEAYSDAQDPTIGFGTSSAEYGTLSSSIFAFQNQLDSLLDEELSLLRGRDNRSAGVQAPPFYNRLLWNFTLGEGEVAYQQAYNVSDQNFDGFIDERDARILYPQGHGDAWGHYLTAITTYYELLQHPFFTWVPRSERVNVAGVAVEVDFLDERKFARAAAARAKVGKEIVDLTYRRFYVEDPAGQWQGYKDTDPQRAWGVTEWASRAGQGAYLDWLTGNTILQSVDPNTNHTGLSKIDRTTVAELGEIADQARAIQATLDQSDQGLNPVGIAKGAVPFDIDPTFLEVGSTAQIGRRAVQGLTQFDQILERAITAMKNSVNAWDQANKGTELLRRNQDEQTQFTRNVIDQEIDYKNRLIEIFGYPYAGDIGPGKTYPSGYDGPDLYHYMYVDNTAVDTATAPISSSFTAFFTPLETEPGNFSYVFNADSSVVDPSVLETEILPVLYPLSDGDFGFLAPTTWGRRRAPGELQMALSDCVQANASLLDALQNYCGLVADIQAAVDLLEAQKNLNEEIITVRSVQLGLVTGINVAIGVMNAVEVNLRRVASSVRELLEATREGLPLVIGLATDATSAARGVIKAASAGSTLGMELTADNLGVAQNALELSKEIIGLSTDLRLEVITHDFEALQRVKELEHMMRDEYNLRIRCYQEAEVVRQCQGRYLAKLAEGERLLQERLVFRRSAAAATTRARYEDMSFRIFRNDALQKYRASFDLAARYVYLAANAYDFEVNFGAQDPRGAARFLTDIVRQRSIGQLVDGNPVVGQPGLADSLARLDANWGVLKTQLGVIQPQIADTRFSLREELFRISGDPSDETANNDWRRMLTQARVANVWNVPEFRRFCRPFAPESAGPQPAIVLRFDTKIEFGLNYFGWPLSAGDSAYDPSQYSTKIARAGIWLSGSDGTQISQTPRVYLVPIGIDVLRTPAGSDLATREFRILDQVIPAPFPIGATDLRNPAWIPINDSLGGSFIQIRRYGTMPARHDEGIYAEQDLTNDTRLIGRSAWNTDWLLIIPGGTLLFDPNQGLDALINSVNDIKIYFQTYSYSGI